MLPFLDTETTGLDPATSTILEVGLYLCDDDLNKLGVEHWVVKFNPRDQATCSEFTQEMHTKNGLFDQCARSGLPLEHVEAKILGWLQNKGYEYGSAPLCGSTISFDRAFLKKYMPNLDAAFHYRSIDLSSMKEATRRWAPAIADTMPPKREAHRVIDDLEDSVELARWMRENIWRAGA